MSSTDSELMSVPRVKVSQSNSISVMNVRFDLRFKFAPKGVQLLRSLPASDVCGVLKEQRAPGVYTRDVVDG